MDEDSTYCLYQTSFPNVWKKTPKTRFGGNSSRKLIFFFRENKKMKKYVTAKIQKGAKNACLFIFFGKFLSRFYILIAMIFSTRKTVGNKFWVSTHTRKIDTVIKNVEKCVYDLTPLQGNFQLKVDWNSAH